MATFPPTNVRLLFNTTYTDVGPIEDALEGFISSPTFPATFTVLDNPEEIPVDSIVLYFILHDTEHVDPDRYTECWSRTDKLIVVALRTETERPEICHSVLFPELQLPHLPASIVTMTLGDSEECFLVNGAAFHVVSNILWMSHYTGGQQPQPLPQEEEVHIIEEEPSDESSGEPSGYPIGEPIDIDVEEVVSDVEEIPAPAAQQVRVAAPIVQVIDFVSSPSSVSSSSARGLSSRNPIYIN